MAYRHQNAAKSDVLVAISPCKYAPKSVQLVENQDCDVLFTFFCSKQLVVDRDQMTL